MEKIIIYLIAVNVITFLMFGIDKHYSRKGMLRIPEKTLLLAALFGGSPGAFLGQRMFRHKTRKGPFQTRFWIVVIMQIAALIYYFQFQPTWN